ncbi:MAG: PUR family DNA/RNA-binding protein [Bacteroidetes bacterium]|nr:PUR family DNA/RNA-binding protein [Bacteroidota bacterium]
MQEGFDNHESNGREKRDEIFSKAVRAGKRTYFFDVKSTKSNDYYLTITESKKRFGEDGKFFYEKHKVFLYKEDFEKFTDGLTEAIDEIKKLSPGVATRSESNSGDTKVESYTNVDFDDLDK